MVDCRIRVLINGTLMATGFCQGRKGPWNSLLSKCYPIVAQRLQAN